MKIAAITAWVVPLTSFETYHMAAGKTCDTVDTVILSLTTDTGQTGWGEVCPIPHYLPAYTAGVVPALQEMATVLLGEIALFTAVAIPVGCAIGYLFAAGLIAGLDTENYRIPLVISPGTYGFAALVVILATLASSWIVQRRIATLDLIAVLKTRE